MAKRCPPARPETSMARNELNGRKYDTLSSPAKSACQNVRRMQRGENSISTVFTKPRIRNILLFAHRSAVNLIFPAVKLRSITLSIVIAVDRKRRFNWHDIRLLDVHPFQFIDFVAIQLMAVEKMITRRDLVWENSVERVWTTSLRSDASTTMCLRIWCAFVARERPLRLEISFVDKIMSVLLMVRFPLEYLAPSFTLCHYQALAQLNWRWQWPNYSVEWLQVARTEPCNWFPLIFNTICNGKQLLQR